jgi:hypothetical protein
MSLSGGRVSRIDASAYGDDLAWSATLSETIGDLSIESWMKTRCMHCAADRFRRHTCDGMVPCSEYRHP